MDFTGNKVYCIIVTYNGMRWIDSCLGSLRASTQQVRVVVIDNLSTDETVEHIKVNFPEVLLIEAGANLGFGKANNIGLNKALAGKADYVFLLNQDAFLASDCLSLLIETSKTNKEYGILSPFHLTYAGNAIEEYFNDFIISLEAPGYVSDLYFEKVKQIYCISFVHAAGWLIPVETLKSVGGFDPLFFHYGEDNDYIQRTRYKSYKIGFVPRAIMFHVGTNAGLTGSDNALTVKRNLSIIRLKNPKASFAGASLVFFKDFFDGVTSGIFYRDGKRIKEEFRFAWTISRFAKKIIKSRQLQLTDLPYLNK